MPQNATRDDQTKLSRENGAEPVDPEQSEDPELSNSNNNAHIYRGRCESPDCSVTGDIMSEEAFKRAMDYNEHIGQDWVASQGDVMISKIQPDEFIHNQSQSLAVERTLMDRDQMPVQESDCSEAGCQSHTDGSVSPGAPLL